MAILIPNMDKPECCDKCRFLDDNGDYPVCIVTGDQRGYNFRIRERVMPSCPLIEIEVDIQTFSFLQEMITKETLTYKELAEAVAIVKEKRKQKENEESGKSKDL